ncbi:MAG: hypothetical protein F6K48_13010 [Okeania sp. SIO3H1]|nr:hypothetical protein [Okeania sp. SIO3H1]
MTAKGDPETFQIRMSGNLTDVQERDLFLALWLKSIGFIKDSSTTIMPELSNPEKVTLRTTWIKPTEETQTHGNQASH